ncbi:phosphotransferase [Blastococcus sp. VKM Ac-2987]|uniref:phosphotransferase n=1 Tax=Blastococcus sp. VKM Ac-2987 TaxID=3004141 RepID=UPI0022AB5F1D|nr:phosphotransferase [Blastococcus sp. VKM Ac-2987]MCZ2860233.1 phosphotransferase [Blastococcus sp. VKM Ac-2987]
MSGADGGGAAARLATAGADVGSRGGRLLRAWPRSPEHLLLEIALGGAPTAGQWFADPDRARAVASATVGATVRGRLVLQPRGADRRLRGLGDLLAAPGAALLAHRPERRAVLRHPGPGGATVYTKVVRPDRLPDLLLAAERVTGLPVRTPRLIGSDPRLGRLTTAALPGRPLHELLGSPAAVPACRALGAALAALHAAPVPPGTPVHDAAAEVAVLRRWSELARTWGAADIAGVEEAAGALAAGPAGRPVLLHRDLHDRQVLVAGDGSVGLLDLDLLAAGEPALDLANLLVHLELRERQGLLRDAAVLREAVLEGYRPSGATLDRVPAHAAATRLRLAAVYAFRPGAPVS